MQWMSCLNLCSRLRYSPHSGEWDCSFLLQKHQFEICILPCLELIKTGIVTKSSRCGRGVGKDCRQLLASRANSYCGYKAREVRALWDLAWFCRTWKTELFTRLSVEDGRCSVPPSGLPWTWDLVVAAAEIWMHLFNWVLVCFNCIIFNYILLYILFNYIFAHFCCNPS